ncbi:polymorphic toxin type 15 domain-containing protein [Enemella dayhoffiae]|uniref:polymorphic toxin type 15 domain-containing protein n=1 Tax=Enemella dayhoffiae TaxID=2016507 RepID=UPI002B4BC01F|nr:polymorphic toxin type 15 domain-containing protein [Enemella dayhoffiae]
MAGKLGKQVGGDLLKHNRCTAKPGPELQKKLDADPWLRREYERQVRLQEKGLHSMSVEDFLRGYTRTGKAQSEMRDRFDNMVQKRVDCGELTEAEAKEMKDSRAALHNPDPRGGGMDRSDVMSLGDRSVAAAFSSIDRGMDMRLADDSSASRRRWRRTGRSPTIRCTPSTKPCRWRGMRPAPPSICPSSPPRPIWPFSARCRALVDPATGPLLSPFGRIGRSELELRP